MAELEARRRSARWWPLLAFHEMLASALRGVSDEAQAALRPRVFPGPVSMRSAVVVVAAGMISSAGGFAAYLELAGSGVAAEYTSFDYQTRAIEVRDAAGRWVGVVPAGMAPRREIAGWPAHQALYVESVPQGWLDVLVALEDQHVGTWRSWRGLDVLALARAMLLAPLGLSERGGSSLAMQLVRSMRHLSPGSDRGAFNRLARKWLEIRHAPMLYKALGGITDIRMQRLLARHLPLVQGTHGSQLGGALYGLGMAARMIFNKNVGDLDLAEQAVLAAAVRRHVLLAPEYDKNALAQRDARWHEIKARAALGLVRAYGVDDERVEAARLRLAALPPPRPYLDPDLVAALPDAPDFFIAAHPERRAAHLIRGELVAALAELEKELSPSALDSLTGLTLTLDVAANFAFKRRVESVLAELEGRLGSRLRMPLRSGWHAPRSADVALVGVAPSGRIELHYSNGWQPIGFGMIRSRNGGGPTVWAPWERPVGSIAKAVLAVALGRYDAPDARYCNHQVTVPPIHNANGDRGVQDCHAKGAWYSAREVFARSMNLPLLWRARDLPDGELHRVAEAAGLRLSKRVSADAALVLGYASAAPTDLAAMMQAVLRGGTAAQATAARPSLVHSYQLLDLNEGLVERRIEPTDGPDLTAQFAERGTAEFVQNALTAPLARGGTLATLRQLRADPHIAKSGTTTVTDGIRDKWIVGAYAASDGIHGYAMLVGTPDPGRPLGRKITGNDLAPLAALLLRESTQPTGLRSSMMPAFKPMRPAVAAKARS